MMQRFLYFLICSLLFVGLNAQDDDPVLFSVAGTPVHVSEFRYIYEKTQNKDASYSKASLDEYLELYTNFKLKVQRAKDIKLDTIKSLQTELAGYRKQLADSYLIDKQVTERLIKEAYDRSQQDVDISHILIKIPIDANPTDSLKAYKRALEMMDRLKNGEDFATVAKAASEDPSASRNGGRIGFVTALFPNGLYALETAAYAQPVGGPYGPIRTLGGYHVLQVNDKRPARGEMEIAHILVRTNDKRDDAAAKAKIDSLYQLLQSGKETFENLARRESDDKVTAPKGGYLGFFGINRYERPFEDAAFAITADSTYTQPIKTSIGYHILKRISKKDNADYNVVRGRLQAKIKEDARYGMAQEAMIERIKEESQFFENKLVLEKFVSSLTDTFLTFKWKPVEMTPDPTLFAFGKDMPVALSEFQDYLSRASRKRIQMARRVSVKDAVNNLYTDFIKDRALAYEEQQLEEKYPDFKSLMREYEEGILLFEIAKTEVWDKASQDTTGLRQFYETVQDNYMWKQRAVISQYSLIASAADRVEEVRKYAQNHSAQEVVAKFNTEDQPILTYQEKTFESGRNNLLDQMRWKPGELSRNEISTRDKSVNFFKIEEILPASKKTLAEARGYVVADYQDQLEKQWIAQLRKDYSVKVNEKVLKKLTQK